MNNPLISIIVPIYNVEVYIRNCVDSILGQSYENLEIILVDDGSPDNCGDICDEYRSKDKRIKVIHKKNGGLSSARNAGIDIASGDYLGFIDSDDWIERDMYESLYNAIIEHKADISVCGRYIVEGDKITTISDSEKAQVFTRSEALTELVLDEYSGMKNFAWDKLYKKELFDDIRYPEGKYYEDIFTTYKLFSKSNKIVDIKSPKYYYLLREDSICGSNNASKRYDYCLANIKCLEYIKSLEPLLGDMCDKQLFNRLQFCLNDMLLLDYGKDDYVIQINEIIDKLKQNYSILRNSDQMGIKQKLSLMFIASYPNLYTTIYPRHKLNKTKIINLLKPIISPRVLNKIKYIKLKGKGSKETKYLYETKTKQKRIFIIGTPNHGNLGDHAIAYAEEKILKDNFKDFIIIEIVTADIIKHIKNLKKNVKKEDVFVLQGGGNLGDEYIWEEEGRRKIISEFKDNKIILFPQSIYFKETLIGKTELSKTKTIYNEHKNLIMVAREETSYNIMKETFVNSKVILTPDIVLYLNETYPKLERKGVLLSLRQDKEGLLTSQQKDNIRSEAQSNFDKIIITDTVDVVTMHEDKILQYMINLNQREKRLKAKWKQFKEVELVITDRLHGLVFCAITSTPCIVIANYNHKVKDTYAWLKDLNYIKFVNDVEEIPGLIKELKRIEIKEYDNSFAMKNYEKILEVMKQR
ncbi:glycosyltransferase [Clostridium estertheticum]|uniref:Glycosyltransferase n=1 Tax=Clostridium estertheticum TaxID=238834 RepID=A0A7Y3ST55_9CLOT|nr:glycosyltransferase [Clostridium estertheticum]NNU74906.1 glycosyltransferase [Clostridium estertheticum]WBL47364.1 glycosyltransferase [Clostridium estertheticum]